MHSSMKLRSSMSPGGAELQELTSFRKRRTSLISPSTSAAEQTQQLLSKGGRGDAVHVVDANRKGDKKEEVVRSESDSEEENSEGDEDFNNVDDQESVVWYIVFVIFVLIPFALLLKMYVM